MSNSTPYPSRAARRRSRSLSRAALTGRAGAATLAAAGLVITGSAAANAQQPVEDTRATTTIDLSAFLDTAERTAQTEAVTVAATADVELSFERPAVRSSAAPVAEPEPAPAPEAPAAEPGVIAASSVTAEQSQPAQQSAPQTTEQPATEQHSTQQHSTQQRSTQQQGTAQQSTAQQAPQQQSAPTSSSQGATAASSSAQETSAPAAGGSLVQAAYAGLGSPYRWGGTSTAGFDCSGFINWVYNQAGRGGLPRTTHGMAASLQHVSSPQPGDIVLANNTSHGAIYVGNGQVISATPSGGVRLHGMHEGWHRVNAIVRPS